MQLTRASGSSGVTHKIDDIQILRGIAIAMVLICHLSFSATLLSALPIHLSNPFYAGVELFFVISGFVVTRSLIRGKYEPISFLIRRGFRLFPPILAFLAFSGLINAAIRLSGRPPFAVDFFCLPFWHFLTQAAAILGGYLINLAQPTGYMNAAMWSLSVEFQFYAAASILAIAALTLRVSSRFVGYIVVASAAGVYAVAAYSRILLTLGHPAELASYIISFKFDYMALGVLLAYIPDSVLGRPIRYGPLLAVGLILLPVGILSLYGSRLVAPAPGPDDLDGAGMLITAVCYAALVGLAVGGNLSQALPRALNRFLFMVGERSYTIYLLHFPAMVVAWVMIVYVNVAWAENAWSYAFVQVVATLVVLVPVTELVYRQLELRSIRGGASVVAAWRRSRSTLATVQLRA
jgi:peptidoglycan/LPS O-acetylase OafA/YrhL